MLNFTPRAQQLLILARKEADRFRHNYIGTEHVLKGLLLLGQGVAINVIQKMGVEIEALQSEVENQLAATAGSGGESTADIPFTPRVKKVLALAGKEAKALNHSYIGTEHLLLGLLREGEGVAARVLKQFNVDLDSCRREILTEIDPSYSSSDPATSGADPMSMGSEEESGPTLPTPEKREIKTPALKAFGRDLTELARNNALDPVVGRKNEIQRVIQILCRRTKNNPVLIGEAGVGKTAIVEGLAQAIIGKKVPDILSNKKVITLDLALMLAGTKYRGQFEERLKTVMDEINRVKNVIIFIDELHTIIGAGSAEGAMDASNIVKPALSRGELQCIGATTMTEYRKHIEKDTALERRFQSVKVDPPSVVDTVSILKGIQSKYEEHHKVQYTDRALESAAKLSDRYITGRYLPDKAIDLLDEAGARARINAMEVNSPDVDAFQKEIDQVTIKKEEAITNQEFEKAAKLRDKEKKLQTKRDKQIDEWKKKREKNRIEVDEEAMFQVVSTWTGIPLSRIEDKESKKLLSLEKDLQKEIIGQEEATEVIARALRRSRADLKDPKRPIGSFLFLGPTGVGKTYLAKLIAEKMFGDKESIVQMDMSEYMEKFAVSRMVGSPPGYVGFEEGGQLTEVVRRKPYSVILFDEIEKAHPDVVQILLQVMEEGRLTDSFGRVVDFRNTILIMTSNIGAEFLQKDVFLGFGQGADSSQNFEKVKEHIFDDVKKAFKPEFINRINEMVVFKALNKEAIVKIVEIEIANLQNRVKDQKMQLEVSAEAKQYLAENGYDKKFGARPLRRAIERYLEDPLAEAILKGDINKTKPISVILDQEHGGLTFSQKELVKKT